MSGLIFCMPCKKIAPIYQQLANKYKLQIDEKDILFLKDRIDDDSIDSVHQAMVQAVPTFLSMHMENYKEK